MNGSDPIHGIIKSGLCSRMSSLTVASCVKLGLCTSGSHSKLTRTVFSVPPSLPQPSWEFPSPNPDHSTEKGKPVGPVSRTVYLNPGTCQCVTCSEMAPKISNREQPLSVGAGGNPDKMIDLLGKEDEFTHGFLSVVGSGFSRMVNDMER